MNKKAFIHVLILSVFTSPFIYSQVRLKSTENKNRIGVGLGLFTKSNFKTYNVFFESFNYKLGRFDVGFQAGSSYGKGWDFTIGSRDTNALQLGRQKPSRFFTLNVGLILKREFSNSIKHKAGISLGILPAYTRFRVPILLQLDPIFINGQLRGAKMYMASDYEDKFKVIIPFNVYYDWRISKKASIGLMPTYYWIGDKYSNIVLNLFGTF